MIALREQSLVSEQTIAERRRTVPAKVHDLLVDLLERQRAAETPLVTDFDETATQVDDRDDCKHLFFFCSPSMVPVVGMSYLS